MYRVLKTRTKNSEEGHRPARAPVTVIDLRSCPTSPLTHCFRPIRNDFPRWSSSCRPSSFLGETAPRSPPPFVLLPRPELKHPALMPPGCIVKRGVVESTPLYTHTHTPFYGTLWGGISETRCFVLAEHWEQQLATSSLEMNP